MLKLFNPLFMLKIYILFLLLVFSFQGFSQTKPEYKTQNRKLYQAWVTLDNKKIIHGLLWNIDSLEVQIKLDKVKNWKRPTSSARIVEIPVDQIQKIRTKKTNAVLKGYGWGAIIGNSTGILVAVGSELAWPENDGHALLIPLFGLAGSFTGLIAGSLPDRTFIINYNPKNLEINKLELNRRAYWTPIN